MKTCLMNDCSGDGDDDDNDDDSMYRRLSGGDSCRRC